MIRLVASVRPSDVPPPVGCDLHFDVSLGCAGDMLIGALLDAGAPLAALKRALTDVGLFGVGPLVQQHRTGGLIGTRVTFVDALGQPLEMVSDDMARHDEGRRPFGRSTPKRTGPTPHRDHRRPASVAEVEREMGEHPGHEGARVLAGPGAVSAESAAGEGERGRPAGDVARWLDDQDATSAALMAKLRDSQLDPITKALAHRTLKLLFQARAATRGGDLENLRFGGRAGLDMLCDVVGACALVRALDPGRITSSRVTVSTAPVFFDGALQPGPLGWVLACLDGIAVDEQALPHPCTTPTGAAIVASLSRRSGPRRHVRERGRGVGLGNLAPPGIANVCRVLLSDPPQLLTREGTPLSGPLVALSATLKGAEVRLGGLLEQLVQLGGFEVHTTAIHDEDRVARTQIHLLADRGLERDLRRLLYLHGAQAVWLREVERHATGVREVTVALGSGMKKQTVRVCERTWADELLSAEPVEEDLARVAETTALSVAAVRADALAAWRHLREPPPAGARNVPANDLTKDVASDET